MKFINICSYKYQTILKLEHFQGRELKGDRFKKALAFIHNGLIHIESDLHELLFAKSKAKSWIYAKSIFAYDEFPALTGFATETILD